MIIDISDDFFFIQIKATRFSTITCVK